MSEAFHVRYLKSKLHNYGLEEHIDCIQSDYELTVDMLRARGVSNEICDIILAERPCCVMCSAHEICDSSIYITPYIDGICYLPDSDGYGRLCRDCCLKLETCHSCARQFDPYSAAFICTECPEEYSITCSCCTVYHDVIADHITN